MASSRREELLDGVMAIIAAHGFSDVRMTDIASELHCSLASLYKIAPNKDSLVVLAIVRWGDRTLAEGEARAQMATTASHRAQLYYQAAAEAVAPFSHAFRRDVERFESTRLAYRTISDGFVNRFAELIDEAAQADEIRPVNARFMAGMFRYIAAAIRDEDLLESAGLTAGEALVEVDTVIWGGLQLHPKTSRGSAS
jgi:AcrR family transcriptional regulator